MSNTDQNRWLLAAVIFFFGGFIVGILVGLILLLLPAFARRPPQIFDLIEALCMGQAESRCYGVSGVQRIQYRVNVRAIIHFHLEFAIGCQQIVNGPVAGNGAYLVRIVSRESIVVLAS